MVSQVKAFGARGHDLDVHDVFPGHLDLHQHWHELKSLEDPLVRQLHIWCLLNTRVVQETAQRHDIVLVHYHDLVLSPKSEVARIVHELGWQPREKDWELDAYLRPWTQTERATRIFKANERPRPQSNFGRTKWACHRNV